MTKLILILFFAKLNIIACGFYISWTSEEKNHNNYITVGGASNLFACIPFDSENCARVLQFKIDDKNNFDCKNQVISMSLRI